MKTAKDNFVITREKTSESSVKFCLKGRIDANHAAEFEHKLGEAFEEKISQIVINMSGVEYLCSNGIRVLLKAYKRAKLSGGQLGIETPSECVKNVLGMVALHEMLIK